MLLLEGKLQNTYTAPTGVNKKTGEEYGGQFRIQLLCELKLQNGDKKLEIVSLSVDDLQPYLTLAEDTIRVPVGVFSAGKGISYYIPKGATPEAA
jgi:hypothetical protein